MKGPQTGRLRERVTIETAVRAQDGAGGTSVTWVPVATVWAEVISFKGTKLRTAEMDEPREPFRVIIRYRTDVKPDMRLVWGDRKLEILSAYDGDGRRRTLVVDAEEIGS